MAIYLNDHLKELYVKNGNNHEVTVFDARLSPELVCIEVDDPQLSNTDPNWKKDTTAVYSEDFFLGLQDLVKNTITVYPNPVSNSLILDSEGLLIGDVSILDMQGCMVKTLTASNIVDVSQLNSGLNFLKIASEGTVVTKKFIKK